MTTMTNDNNICLICQFRFDDDIQSDIEGFLDGCVIYCNGEGYYAHENCFDDMSPGQLKKLNDEFGKRLHENKQEKRRID